MPNEPHPWSLNTPAPNINAKLIKLEREIAGIANRIRAGMSLAQTWQKTKDQIGAATNLAKQKFVASIELAIRYAAMLIKTARKLHDTTIRSGSNVQASSTRQKSIARASDKVALQRKARPDWDRAIEHIIISVCLGLIVICGVLIAALFLQITDLKAHVERTEMQFATSKMDLDRVERLLQQTTKAAPAPATKASEKISQPLSFSDSEIRVIRQFIKVLPSKPGALEKIHLGDEATKLSLAPLPEALINQMSKLRGARFSIDENGSIIIVAAGSNRVDVVINYQ
jgi:hypothetical protein